VKVGDKQGRRVDLRHGAGLIYGIPAVKELVGRIMAEAKEICSRSA